MSIKLQFVLGLDFSSQAISWFSSGHLSHVDAVLPDGRLLGARSDIIMAKGVAYPAGVQIRPAGYEPWAARVPMELPATAVEEAAFYGFLRSQVGKPYDKLAILAFALDRDWRDEDSWICSELQTRALEVAGLAGELYLPANKITPVACALVVSALGGKVI